MNSKNTKEKELIHGLLSGAAESWSEIYHLHHRQLLITIRKLTVSYRCTMDMHDEIAARVWFAIVDNRDELLLRLSLDQGDRLRDLLTDLAKQEASIFFRSRRKSQLLKHAPNLSNKRKGSVNKVSASSNRLDSNDFTDIFAPSKK